MASCGTHLLSSLFNVGHQFGDLVIKAFFSFLLKLGEVTFKVSFLPVFFPFSAQRGLHEGGSSRAHEQNTRGREETFISREETNNQWTKINADNQSNQQEVPRRRASNMVCPKLCGENRSGLPIARNVFVHTCLGQTRQLRPQGRR